MFGSESLTLDAKGRVAIPVYYREDLVAAAAGEPLVLTAHPHGCLVLYPAGAWAPLCEKLLKIDDFDDRRAPKKRLMLGLRQLIAPADLSERILIKPQLRQHAQLEKGGWVMGMGNHLQIWSESAWNRQAEKAAAPDEDFWGGA
ncbi:MAG: division/cell wall cluster transcriptional repressor MraZ [Candidatus Accumulibacter sp.]|jgi:MraZ protein|nr:division/cell wall cluster transcriptional repressor MraZ [Accumulibacter sp.]